MSTTPAPAAPAAVDPDAPTYDRRRDVVWVLLTLLVLGAVGGLVWWAVADPPLILRTAQGAVLDQAQLGRRINADGWFAVVGFVGGAVAGFTLVRPRRRDPLLVVLLGTAAAVGAAYLALWIGTTLGDVPRAEVLDAKVGTRVTGPLQLISHLVVVAWPIGFLVAAVAVLFGGERPARDDPAAVDVPSPTP